MQNLVLAEGELVVLRNLQLPKATFARFRPHSKARACTLVLHALRCRYHSAPVWQDFLDITDHKAVLERQLSRFSALTKGDVVCFRYADRNHYMDVLELKPAVSRATLFPCKRICPAYRLPSFTQDAVTIIETDCAVDFAPPVDYVEPIYKPAAPPVASVSAGIGGRGGTAGLGTLESPFMLDDDDAPRTGSGAPPFYPAGGAPPAGEGYLKRVRALGSSPHVGSAAAASPIGGVSAAGAAPPPLSLAGGSPMVGAAAATAAGGSSVTPFAGTGRRLADSGGVSESKGGGITSPSLSPSLTPAAGGVVLMPGPGASSRPQRTLNRFEQARAAKAFQGQGKSLLE